MPQPKTEKDLEPKGYDRIMPKKKKEAEKQDPDFEKKLKALLSVPAEKKLSK